MTGRDDKPVSPSVGRDDVLRRLGAFADPICKKILDEPRVSFGEQRRRAIASGEIEASRVVSMSAASCIELGRSDNDAAARGHSPLRHCTSKTLNFGPVPFKYLQKYFFAVVLPVQSLPDQQSVLRYLAPLKDAIVANMKVHEVATDHGHIGPRYVPSKLAALS